VDAVLPLALPQGAIVRSAPGSAEHCYTSAEVAGLNSALQAAQGHHVTVVASSGDLGAAMRSDDFARSQSGYSSLR